MTQLLPTNLDGIFVDRLLNFYDTWKDRKINFSQLIKTHESGLTGEYVDLSSFGLNYKPSVKETYAKLVLGVGRGHLSFKDGNLENLDVDNLLLNHHPIHKILEYRLENVGEFTPQESRMLSLLRSREFVKLFRDNIHQSNRKSKKYWIIPESPVVYEKSFYLIDILINGLTVDIGIELDGNQHYTPEGLEYDSRRDQAIFELHGIKILRFRNSDLALMSDEQIYTKIKHVLVDASKLNLKSQIENLLPPKSVVLKARSFDEILSELSLVDTFKFCILRLTQDAVECKMFTNGNLSAFRTTKDFPRSRNKLELGVYYSLAWAQFQTIRKNSSQENSHEHC